MAEGKIIEYIDQREIVLSVCLKDRGNRLQLLTLSNHEVSISPKRALVISSTTLDTSRSREELLKEMKVVENRRIDFMTKVAVQDLWELTHEENEAFTYEYLAHLSFGKNVTDDHISGLVRALFADKIYFKMKDGYFIPNSPDKVEQIRKARDAIDPSGREDLTDLSIFTIDGPFTRDFDDALSLQPIDEGYRLGVHITDLAPFIQVDGHLDREASARASSIYLPVDQIPMFPSTLSNNVLSLLKGFKRLAISLMADFDRDWNLKDYRFIPSIVRTERQLTYDQVSAVYADEPTFSALYQLSQALRQKRIANGALLIPLPEIHFEFDDNSGIRVRLIEQDTPAKIIVSECMILYNWLAAKFASETALLILYRSQEPPQERLFNDESDYIYYVFQQRRKLQPLFIDIIPQPHSGLGVEVYTNATSPLRRYMDLVVQRQIHSALLKKSPVYNESRLKELNLLIQQTLRDIDLMKRNQTRYWILKYLAGRINNTFNAIVFQRLKYK